MSQAEEKIATRAIPHDFDAEQWVLSSLLLDGSRLQEVFAKVRPDDFEGVDHRVIYDEMRGLYRDGKPVSVELLLSRLRRHSEFDVSVLFKLAEFAPNAAHVVHYSEIVSRHGLSRRIISTCTKLLSDAYDGVEPELIIKAMQAEASSLAATGGSYKAPALLSDVADKVASALEAPESADGVNRAAWGLYSVDDRLGPLMPGEVAIVAARPGMGKTAWGFQMLRHSAEHDRPALFVSLEMEATELATRDLSRLSDIDSRRIRRGEIDDVDVRSIRNAQSEIGDLPLYLWSPHSATLAEIRGVLVNAIDRHGVRLACVDYLSLIEVEAHQRKDMRHLQVAAISRGLKRLAKELKIPLVVLQQLNREADNAEPKLSNLRESGAVEQDADVVMFLHHGMIGKQPMPANQRMLIVPKFRAGPMGQITVRWDGKHTRFSDPEVMDHKNYEKIFDDFNNRQPSEF